MTTPQTDLRADLARDGYVLIPSAIPATDLETFRAAATTTTTAARAGHWPHIRTLPKAFPPWPTTPPPEGIWGVQHLLHPAQPSRLTFAHSYFHPAILSAVTELIQCGTDELVMELYNMLVRPESDFALHWHRDDIGPDASAEEEEQRLKHPMLHAQWNLALHDDASLIVVPGSHKRARTQAERDTPAFSAEMPGQVVVAMKAGDVVFYDNNILHRGVYDCSKERMTLHGTMGRSGEDGARARNILQHGVGGWVGDDGAGFEGLGGETGELAEGMRRRLVGMGKGEGVGFSQVDG